MERGIAFTIQARFKLFRGESPWGCTPGRFWGPLAFQHEVCLTLSLRYEQGGQIVVRDMGVVSDFTKGEWNTVSGVFIATDEMVLVDSMFAA